jgi:hypothetical protein
LHRRQHELLASEQPLAHRQIEAGHGGCHRRSGTSRRAAATTRSSSSGGAPRADDEEEEAEEGEDPLFLEAVAADMARAEAAHAIIAVNELMAREAAATTPLIILDD